MDWASSWAIFSRTHLVTLVLYLQTGSEEECLPINGIAFQMLDGCLPSIVLVIFGLKHSFVLIDRAQLIAINWSVRDVYFTKEIIFSVLYKLDPD
jgi:hypothetical protein